MLKYTKEKSSQVKKHKFVTSKLESDALRDCPFELHENIKCDKLKFLKFSKVVSTFLITYFQSILQNFPVYHVVRK